MNPDDYNIDELKRLYAITTSMASNGVSGYDTYASNITASSVAPWTEHHIKGEMLIATARLDEAEVQALGKEKIRENLAMQIASELLASKHIEFTQMRDRFSGALIVKARVYVVPDNQVRILRTNGA